VYLFLLFFLAVGRTHSTRCVVGVVAALSSAVILAPTSVTQFVDSLCVVCSPQECMWLLLLLFAHSTTSHCRTVIKSSSPLSAVVTNPFLPRL
jgi:hypothetical protein